MYPPADSPVIRMLERSGVAVCWGKEVFRKEARLV